ncbi:hypothetical protein [Actinopolyspora mzabensis]|nr:hypothetical protein [Actinopolyspora mzabensis]
MPDEAVEYFQKISELGDEWTRSSADLSDAATSDDDPSNWQVRR